MYHVLDEADTASSGWCTCGRYVYATLEGYADSDGFVSCES